MAIRFDNFLVDVIGEEREQFDLAMKLAFTETQEATHWAITKAGSLVLMTSEVDDVDFIVKSGEFPSGMNVATATAYAWEWLKKAKITEEEPDHDGDNHVGWRVSTTNDADMSGSKETGWATLAGESKKLSPKQLTVQIEPNGHHDIWDSPCGFHQAIVAIRPWWAMYGK